MENGFGLALRALRKQKALSQNALAEKSGVALRTVAYWESGERLPRVPELQAALKGLNAAPEEAAPLLELLTTPRGIRLAERTRAEEMAIFLPGTAPGIGDLIQTMRTRRRITQSELAERLRVSRRAVMRWEAGENLISGDNLERLCVLLGVAPEEQAALRRGRLILPQWENRDWRKITVEEAAHFWRSALQCQQRMVEDYRPQTPLFELYALAMKRHLRFHAAPNAGARELLGKIETDHAVWLYYNDRDAQSRRCVSAAIQLIEGQSATADYWATALNLNVSFAQGGKEGMRGSLRLLEQWIPRLPPGCVRTQQLCDLAVYRAANLNAKEAWARLEQAERSMNRPGGAIGPEIFYYKTASERIRLITDRVSEISETLLTQCANNLQRIHLALLWADQLERRSEESAAQRYVTLARELETSETPARLKRRIAACSLSC